MSSTQVHQNWDLYDTRHVVSRPRGMSPEALEAGYWRAYREFYTWRSIARGAWTKPTLAGTLRHVAYAGGWKKFEPMWDWVIRAKRVGNLLPLLEAILSGFGQQLEPESAKHSQAIQGSASGGWFNTQQGNKQI